jgi:L-gulono-1,4-lactone dehydrogenase
MIMAEYQSIKKNFKNLKARPEDANRQNIIEQAFEQHPDIALKILKREANKPSTRIRQVARKAVAGLAQFGEELDWVNSVGGQKCMPLKKVRPKSLKHLVEVVKAAGEQKQRVRAVGSGHAFSDVARTDDAVLIDPILLNHVSDVDLDTLKKSAKDLTIINVQAGITTRNFKQELENRGLALINMGGYDGQTISGTLSTGTHGSGITFGPLASFAKSVVVVSETGTVYQIEPKDGITDPEKFSGMIDGAPVVLKQDDEWFRSILVAVGCLGIIYSYVMEVTGEFSIEELRTSTTWETIKDSLLPDKWNPVAPIVADVDHFELVLNPYNRWFRNACIKVERKRLGDVPQKGQRKDWLGALLEKVAINSAPDLIRLLNKIPFISPLVIDLAIMTLVEEEPYIDKSYNVFSLGEANEIKAKALELHCDAKECVPTIDKLLKVFQEGAAKRSWYMAGPLGIRFVAPSEAFIAPEAGRMTCTIELDMLVGVTAGEELAKHVKEQMCEPNSSSVRVHWGLDLDLATKEDIRGWYPDFERWHSVYLKLNKTGMFNNKFTDRVGISVAVP